MKYLLVLVVHSKWLEVHPVNPATAAVTIEKLRFIFSTHGLPDMIVSGNRSVFTSKEFADFMTYNGITHVKSFPYHPSTNGLAKRAVQTFKAGIKKQTEDTLESKLSHFLFHYHLTPQTIRCHIDYIRIRHSPPQQDISTEAAIDDSFMFPQHAPQQSPVLRRSTRIKHPPDHFS